MEVHLNSLHFISGTILLLDFISGFLFSFTCCVVLHFNSIYTVYRNASLPHLQTSVALRPFPYGPTHTAGLSFTNKTETLLHLHFSVFRFSKSRKDYARYCKAFSTHRRKSFSFPVSHNYNCYMQGSATPHRASVLSGAWALN